VDYYALKRRSGAVADSAPSFVELLPAGRPGSCVVELSDGRGGTMRVQLAGEDVGARLEALARGFWGRGA
jgi:hypothetical protein